MAAGPRQVSRRDFLVELTASATLAVALPAAARAAQSAPASADRPWRIDTHAHWSSPRFFAQNKARGITSQDALQDWSAAKMVPAMDRDGIATSMLTISDPGVWNGDSTAARAMARELNEIAAKAVSDYPGRFGFMAVLPLPDVDGALREIEYAFNTLKADGVGLLSSYGDKYLGNPAFAQVMDELNRRKAVVFTHPACPACMSQATLGDGQARGMEFVFDTTRAIVSVLSTGTAARCADIKFLWSHAGGTAPYITGRIPSGAATPNGVVPELQKFYYDTSLAFSAYTLPTFKKLVPTSHILFGTDFPLGGGGGQGATVKGLVDNGGFSDAELQAVFRDNALALFQRLK